MPEVATSAGRAAVLGRPIGHSLSPVLHRAAYRALGVDWTYEAIDCGVDELPGLLAERRDWAGFSCTTPLKRAVLDVADRVAPRAAAVGSGNTLYRAGDGWIAENTDAPGLAAAVVEAGVAPRSMTLLGAGGTAQAALGAAVELGVTAVTVLAREPARTSEVRGSAERLGVAIDVRTFAAAGDAWEADLVVSTLPSRAADPLAEREWHERQAVLDVVYDGWPTALAAAAARRGATVVSGALLLLHQAALQVELMTGRAAPVAAMREALRAATAGV